MQKRLDELKELVAIAESNNNKVYENGSMFSTDFVDPRPIGDLEDILSGKLQVINGRIAYVQPEDPRLSALDFYNEYVNN